MPQDISQSQDYWDRYARHDPMWAVLSDPNRKGRWDLPQFMETGRREISLLMYQLRTLEIPLDRSAALDFGCGLGRLTQALGDVCDRVVGVDISPEMVRLAGELNRHAGRVRYVVNGAEDLRQFGSGDFTFVNSDIVLQHIDPRIAASYIREFFRIVAPGGVVVFHLSSHLKPVDAHTPRHGAMPDDAYRASVAIEPRAGTTSAPASEIALQVSLKNESDHEWSQPRYGSLRIGNHWRSAAGSMLVQDDGRATLPQHIQPGESVVASLVVTTPAEAGTYVCEVDAVHEGVTWFGDRGSRTATFSVVVGRSAEGGAPTGADTRTVAIESSGSHEQVEVVLPQADPARAGDGEPDPDDPGPFPMHGIHTDAVTDLIRDAGGELLHKASDDRLPEWIAFRYFARRNR